MLISLYSLHADALAVTVAVADAREHLSHLQDRSSFDEKLAWKVVSTDTLLQLENCNFENFYLPVHHL